MHHHHHHCVDYNMTACSASIQLRLNHLLQTEASMLVPHIKQLYSNLCRARTFWRTLMCARTHTKTHTDTQTLTHTHDSTGLGFWGVSAFFHIFLFKVPSAVSSFDVCPYSCSSCAHVSWKCCQVERRKPKFGELNFFDSRSGLNWSWGLPIFSDSTGSPYLAIKPKALDIQTPTNTRHEMKLTAVCKYSFLTRHSNPHSNVNKTRIWWKAEILLDWNNVWSITAKEHQFF